MFRAVLQAAMLSKRTLVHGDAYTKPVGPIALPANRYQTRHCVKSTSNPPKLAVATPSAPSTGIFTLQVGGYISRTQGRILYFHSRRTCRPHLDRRAWPVDSVGDVPRQLLSCTERTPEDLETRPEKLVPHVGRGGPFASRRSQADQSQSRPMTDAVERKIR